MKRFEEFEVEAFDEDPRLAGHTIIENYFLLFWKPLLGNDAGDTYELLKSYCYGEKNTCYPSRKTLAFVLGIRRNRLTEIFDRLEKYKFLKIQTFQENSQNSRTVFQVARTPPLIEESFFEEMANKERREWLRKRHR